MFIDSGAHYQLFLPNFNPLLYSLKIFEKKNLQISGFIEILPVGAEFSMQTDRRI